MADPSPPTIRLVVLNYNGGEAVLRCVQRLTELRWPADRLQVVVVDNASADGSDLAIEERFPGVRLIRSPENTGFPANNLALRDLEGVDLVGLINNDAFATPDYLAGLVDELAADPGLGAVCPKIVLAPRFLDLRLTTEGFEPANDSRRLGVRLSGLRVGGREVERGVVHGDGWWPPERGGPDEASFRWSGVDALLRVPVADGADPDAAVADRVEVRLAAATPATATLDGGAGPVEVQVGTAPSWFEVPIGGEPYDVINNCGSELVEGGWGRDRGFLQPDRGQFEEPVDVFAWCGAGVLFRVEYLREVGLFDERFFMYYEDTDLSWRGRSQGWRYRYVPTSLLRHMHAATSVEGSPMFHHFVERNRLLMLAKNAPTRFAARAAGRYLLSTASYGRRDVVRPVLAGHRPSTGLVKARLRSFAGFVRLAPAMLADHRRLARAATVHDEALLGWQAPH